MVYLNGLHTFRGILYHQLKIIYEFLFLQTVGPGGSPDENGETTIDAMIMNGV